METAARSLQLQLRPTEVKAPDDLDGVFTSMTGQVDAFVMGSTQMLFNERRRIGELAAKRLPAMHGVRTYVEVGGLVSYGADEPDLSRRAGAYVARILDQFCRTVFGSRQNHLTRPAFLFFSALADCLCRSHL
jgi:putative tryptophan/tyrosine transport system substrate-binding protein